MGGAAPLLYVPCQLPPAAPARIAAELLLPSCVSPALGACHLKPSLNMHHISFIAMSPHIPFIIVANIESITDMVVHGIPRYPAESSSILGCDFDNQQGIKHEKLSVSKLSTSLAEVPCIPARVRLACLLAFL